MYVFGGVILDKCGHKLNLETGFKIHFNKLGKSKYCDDCDIQRVILVKLWNSNL